MEMTTPWNDSPPHAFASWNDSPPRARNADIPGVLFAGAASASGGGGSARLQPAFAPVASSHRPLAAARIDFDTTGEVWSSAPWSARSPLTPDERQLRAEERGRLARLQLRREKADAERQEGERHLRRAHGAYVGAASSAHAITRLRDEAAADQRRAVARRLAAAGVSPARGRGGSPPPSSRRPPLAAATTSFAPPSARRRSPSRARSTRRGRGGPSTLENSRGRRRFASGCCAGDATLDASARCAPRWRARRRRRPSARASPSCTAARGGWWRRGVCSALCAAGCRRCGCGTASPPAACSARRAAGSRRGGGATSGCTARGGRRRRAAATAASSSIGRRGGRRSPSTANTRRCSASRDALAAAGPLRGRWAELSASGPPLPVITAAPGTPRGRPAHERLHTLAEERRELRQREAARQREREASAEVAHCTFTPRTNSSRAKFADVQPRIDCGPRRTSPAAQRPPSPARDAPPPLAATRPPPARADDDGDDGWVTLARS